LIPSNFLSQIQSSDAVDAGNRYTFFEDPFRTLESKITTLLFYTWFSDNMDFSNDVKIDRLMLHMHTRKITGKIVFLRVTNVLSTLFNIEKWAVDWQQKHYLNEIFPNMSSKLFNPRCTFDNSDSVQQCAGGKSHESKDVFWGEKTNDETCISNLLIAEG